MVKLDENRFFGEMMNGQVTDRTFSRKYLICSEKSSRPFKMSCNKEASQYRYRTEKL